MSCAMVSFSGGGLKFWLEAYSTSTQTNVSFTPIVADANVSAVIKPKGTGALLAAIPDGTATGGNARGQYAVDLQMARSAATQVAASNYGIILGGSGNKIAIGHSYAFIGGGSGNDIQNGNNYAYTVIVGGQSNVNNSTYSFIGGGLSNSAAFGNNYSVIAGGRSNNHSNVNRDYRTICGGFSNTTTENLGFVGGGQSNSVSLASTIGGGLSNNASGSYASIIGGQSNTASGQHSFVGGGHLNDATDTWSTVGGGYDNTAGSQVATVGGGAFNNATGSNSVIPGGRSARTTLYAQLAHAAGEFSVAGDAQAHELIWRRAITGTVQTELFLDGASIAAILPGTNSVWNGIIDVTSICTVTGDGTTVVGHVAATSYKVTIKRIGTTTSLVGGVQEIGITNADASMSTAAFAIDNNDTNESLRVRFTPPATAGSTTVIRTIATFRGQQIQY